MRGRDVKPRRLAVNNVRALFRFGQRGQQGGQQLVAGENTQLELTVVDQRIRTQLLSTSRLAAIADPNHQRITLPVKRFPGYFALIRLQGI
ncbi:hypothetical protein D3C75_665720 [compost metagenome]